MIRILIFFILIAVGCQEQVELDFQSGDEYLVIDGFITTDFGPHTISISKSEPFTNDEIVSFRKVQGATVMIIDDLGIETFLQENSPGNYQTPSSFRGIVGRSYSLTLSVDGDTYQSSNQPIPEPSLLDSLFFIQTVRETINDDGVVLESPAVQFVADISYSTVMSYSAITWESTFKYETSLGQTPYDCYVDEINGGFSKILSNENISIDNEQGVLVGELLFDVRFKSAYSLNAIIYSFSDEAYEYFFKVNQQRSSKGSVFDPQPFQIYGNVRNISNPEEIVLGYFGAFSIDERRVFVYPPDIDAPQPFDICSRVGGPGFPPKYCYDCAQFPGARTIKPSYWKDQ